MSAHNSIDEVLIALAEIDIKIWDCQRFARGREDDPEIQKRISLLLEERENLMRKWETTGCVGRREQES